MLQGPRMNSRGMQNRFYGPGMMGGPGMGQRQMYSSPFGHGPRMPHGQMPRMMGRNTQSRQGGGLLSKILGKGSRGQGNGISGLLTGGSGPARGASGGGILKTLADPSALNGFLTNTQKVLNTAQQFGPMIQQYGPLVRNLPSMWRLYKGLKDLPDADEQNEPTAKQETEETIKKKKNPQKSQKVSSRSPTQKKTVQKQSNSSASSPKLFI